MSDSVQISAKVAYGVELCATEAVVVRMGRGGAVRKEPRIALAEDSLKGLHDRSRKERAVVAMALPVRDSFTQWIEAPFPSVAKARRVFDSLLDIHLPFPVDACVYDIMNLNRSADGKVQALAGGAVAGSIRELVARFNAYGVDPEVIDHEGLALWDQALVEFPATGDECRVVAYLSDDRMVIVRGRGARYEYAQSAELKTDAGLPTPESLTKISRRMSRAFDRESGGDCVCIWSGSGAVALELRDSISTALRIESDVEQVVSAGPAEFLALSLARRALGRAGAESANCRRGALTHPRILEQARRRARLLAASALLSVVGVCVVNILAQSGLKTAHAAVDDAVQQAALEVSGMTRVPRGQELEVVARELANREREISWMAGFFEPSPGMHLMQFADLARQNGIYLNSVTLRDDKLAISGSVADWDRCEALSALASRLGYTAELRRSDAVTDERVHFSIEGVRR